MNESLNTQVLDGTGPFLLLVHGMLCSKNQWLLNIEALAKVCRPVLVELYGHHNSPSPTDPELYLPENYVIQFEKIRRHLDVERWFICGYSLGAALTLHYALAYPKRIYGSIFTNSNSAFAEAGMARLWKINAEKNRQKFLGGGMESVNRIAVHPRHAKRIPEVLRAKLVRDSLAHNPLGIANTMTYTSPCSSVRNTIHNNTVPALLVCGRYEKRFVPHREFAERNIPKLKVASLATSHAVNMEAPNEFNHEVSNFIQAEI